MNYPPTDIRFKYYGKHIEQLVTEAVASTEDASKRESLTIHIARLMKHFYQEWNRENISDETLAKHLLELSADKLSLDLEKVRAHGLLDQPLRMGRGRHKAGSGKNNAQGASRYSNNRRNKRKKA